MRDEIRDKLKSFVLGLAFPLALACFAVSFMTGGSAYTRSGTPLTPVQAFGYSAWRLGIALFIHGFFFGPYENRPGLRFAILSSGVISFIVGLYLQFK
jgi:hypothetical protein